MTTPLAPSVRLLRIFMQRINSGIGMKYIDDIAKRLEMSVPDTEALIQRGVDAGYFMIADGLLSLTEKGKWWLDQDFRRLARQ